MGRTPRIAMAALYNIRGELAPWTGVIMRFRVLRPLRWEYRPGVEVNETVVSEIMLAFGAGGTVSMTIVSSSRVIVPNQYIKY